MSKVWTQKCKSFTFTDDLHTLYIRLLTLTCTTLVTTRVRQVLETASNPCWVSSWVSKLIIMIIKKNQIKCLVLIHNCGYQKSKYLLIIYDHGSPKNQIPTLKLSSLCPFFHETRWFFYYIHQGFFCGELNSPFGNQKKMALQGVQRVFFFGKRKKA